jgi:NADH dehydrogenase (ubiquinone) 1 alpha subcomplex subunit 4
MKLTPLLYVRNSRTNRHPWQEIKDGEQVKLIALNQKYDHRWERKNW